MLPIFTFCKSMYFWIDFFRSFSLLALVLFGLLFSFYFIIFRLHHRFILYNDNNSNEMISTLHRRIIYIHNQMQKEKKIVARELYKFTCASVDTQSRTAGETKKCSLFLHNACSFHCRQPANKQASEQASIHTYTMANENK